MLTMISPRASEVETPTLPQVEPKVPLTPKPLHPDNQPAEPLRFPDQEPDQCPFFDPDQNLPACVLPGLPAKLL